MPCTARHNDVQEHAHSMWNITSSQLPREDADDTSTENFAVLSNENLELALATETPNPLWTSNSAEYSLNGRADAIHQ